MRWFRLFLVEVEFGRQNSKNRGLFVSKSAIKKILRKVAKKITQPSESWAKSASDQL